MLTWLLFGQFDREAAGVASPLELALGPEESNGLDLTPQERGTCGQRLDDELAHSAVPEGREALSRIRSRREKIDTYLGGMRCCAKCLLTV